MKLGKDNPKGGSGVSGHYTPRAHKKPSGSGGHGSKMQPFQVGSTMPSGTVTKAGSNHSQRSCRDCG